MDKAIRQLEGLLHEQLAAHDRLAGLVERKLNAIRSAQPREVVRLTEQENQVVQALGELEKRRLLLVAELTRAASPAAKEPMRLRELAQSLAEPARGRLLVLRQRLEERMSQVGRQAGVARDAAESLARHMQGVVQSVAFAIGQPTYHRRGAPARAGLPVSTFTATG